MADRIIFRKWTRAEARGDIIAFMPDTPANPGMVMAYEHVGQHGEADYNGLLSETVPAKPEEFADLLAELKAIGYEPRIMKRLNRK